MGRSRYYVNKLGCGGVTFNDYDILRLRGNHTMITVRNHILHFYWSYSPVGHLKCLREGGGTKWG